ncbi:MAG: c-type cytochrome [Granulosicoccus sp.]|nr:c-type cytochrome [Granulosicoccus sp.]
MIDAGVRKQVIVLSLGLLALAVLAAYLIYPANDQSDAVANPVSPDANIVDSIAQRPQREGDPAVGRRQLLDGDYVSCGLPERVFLQLLPNDETLLLADREGTGRDLPYFNNRVVDSQGNSVISNNCLTCHAAPLFGEIVMGLGNEFLDFTSDENSVEKAGLLVRGVADTRVWQKFADRIAAVAPYTRASTVGVNVANNLTYALMAHFDPLTLTWSDQPLMELPDREPLPVSVPPWWRMQKKQALFYQGQGQGDHARIMILAALLCADDIDEVKKADSFAVDIRAYIESLRAPRYPFPIDGQLAAEGETVFQQTCLGCHGSYGPDAQYPNKLVSLDIVGTDPELALQAIEYQRFNDWFEKSWYGTDAEMIPAQGYMAPPLDGVWATGPFLHNGSVPTIAALLNSKERPRYWRHAGEKSFDTDGLGWRWESIEDISNSTDSMTSVYNTERFGYGNEGHLFGDHLSAEQRAAVLEYLKTL